VRASQQAALDTYLNGHIRPLFVRQLHEERAVLPALAVYSRAPTRVDERAASRAVERMEVKERVLSDLIDSVVAPVPLRNAQLTLGEAFHSEDELLTILIYDIPHRPPARVLRVAREFRILIRPPVRSWLRAVVRYAHERHLEVPAWLAPSGGSPNGGSGRLAALRAVLPPASVGSVSS
jgi:hypothetical protein